MRTSFQIRRHSPRIVIGSIAGALAIGLGLFALTRAEGSDPVDLQMHRAVYDLSVDRVKAASEVEGLDGRMVVEWRGGPACEGYTSEQRVVTRSSDEANAISVSDVRLTSFESLDGHEFRFDRVEYADGKPSLRQSGHVYRKGGRVVLEEEGKEPAELPGDVLFPTAFNVALLQAARDGKTVFSNTLFDGTQSTATYVTAFIGKRATAPADARKVRIRNRGAGATLDNASPWHVHVSYFDQDDRGNDETPSFEMGFAMFPNGVMSALTLDYDDMVLKGDLTQIEYFKPGAC